MTTHHQPTGSHVTPTNGHGATTDHPDPGAPADRFDNPGLPAHRHRLADLDAVAAKRAERQVAALFGLSILGTVFTGVAYFTVKFEGDLTFNAYLHQVQLSTLLIGVGMFLSLFCIGIGAVHWAKTLMPDDERIEYRHLQRGTDQDRADAVEILAEGAAEAGLGRRPLIRNSLIGSLALMPLPGVFLLRDLGPMPSNSLSVTVWKKGDKLVLDQVDGKPIKAADLQIGSVVHVMPEKIDELGNHLDERAKASVLVMRLNPDDLDEASRPGSYQGIVAYSKICTHMGCPVGLYEQQTHHLLCPCHQSTFDLTRNCEVIFGPAKRALPQLAITVDDEGYLVAKDGFREAVGPSFWERG
jgi:ubiquinol-cytochrome c reductase iron-sulfur subunit